MVSLTFFGGANEIGGNKILLEDKGAKIYLDFGESFDFGDDFFYEFLSPRSVNGLEVYFEFGLMPKVKGLYSKAMLEYTDVKYEKPDVDAVFISHSHSDHVNHLAFLDESIPIYIGHGAFRVLEAYRKLYPGLYDIGEHENLNFFKSGEEIRVKHLVIQPVHVEHSVPGAYGFIINSSKGAIVYSGDFRLHGPKSELTREFIEKARQAKPLALLCEGTRMGEEGGSVTEKEVEEKLKKIIAESKGLVMASFSMSNVDRFLSFYEAAKKCKRKLVIDTRFAFILDQLREKIASLPDVRTDEGIQVYYRMAKSCTFCEKDYAPWEREYLNKMVTWRDVSRDAKSLVMHVGFYRLMELVYIRPKNADFIYSMSEHFLEGEENEKQKEVLE
ncbi:MAG: MBL fold metallo-hydrolase, partial [Candidatus Pacebacteria bacterium]|nr:MBL fold metallo-hydrolase [Candidatus Paceibacterota bacterium]